MTIETMGNVKKIGYDSKMIKKKLRYRKRIMRRSGTTKGLAKTTTLQELVRSCKEAFNFKGPETVPSSSDVKNLSRILDNMKPEDVGLSKKLQFFKPSDAARGSPRVTYATIYQCDEFSLYIFFLPAKATIPLHNHPGMTVFSKLLLGTMHIKSYDWVHPPTQTNHSRLRLGRLKADSSYTAPCETNILYPTSGGNIHEFTAITPCAVLDVVGPPYSAKDGRDCSYYKDFPFHDFPIEMEKMGEEESESGGYGYGWLEEIEVPEDSHMDGIEYLGPQVLDP